MRQDEIAELVLRTVPDASSSMLGPVTALCGGWPLLATLVGASVSGDVSAGATTQQALDIVSRALRVRGLVAHALPDLHQSLLDSIYLYDDASAEPAATLAGHRGRVLMLGFSAGDASLVSAAADGTVRRWSLDGSGSTAQVRVDASAQCASYDPSTPCDARRCSGVCQVVYVVVL